MNRPGPRTSVMTACDEGHLSEAHPQVSADALGLLGEPLALDHVEHGRADRCGHGRPRERREEVPALRELCGDGWRRDDGSHRMPVAHRLPEGDDVGPDAVLGEAPNAVPTLPNPACTSSARTESSDRTRALVGSAEVAGRDREDPVARKDVVVDEQCRVVAATSQPRDGVVDLAVYPDGGIRCAECGGAANPRHPGLERLRPSSSGESAAVAAVVPW